jgi:hypothetical protein
LLKFGLLFLLANLFLKLFIGIGLWKMAIENKYAQDELGMKSSLKYAEEQIEEGDPTILRGRNDNQREGRIFPTSEQGNQIRLRDSCVDDL